MKEPMTNERFREISISAAKSFGVNIDPEHLEGVLQFASHMHTMGYMGGWTDADDANREYAEYMKDPNNHD